jgi:hypothetical protein
MKISISRSVSFPQPLSGMLKPYRYLYFAGFREREKLLDVLETYSLRPAIFEQRQSALVMPIPATENFSEFRFCNMFRNLIMLPDAESRLDLLAIRNLPRCFHQPELMFRAISRYIPEDYQGKLIGLRRYYGNPKGSTEPDFFGSCWIPDEIFDNPSTMEKPALQDLGTKKREFRLRLCCFRNRFYFELREQQGEEWQSDPELFLSSDDSQILLFLILIARNTGASLAGLMKGNNFRAARNSHRSTWESVGKLLQPKSIGLTHKYTYRQRNFSEPTGNEENAAFIRVVRTLESTGFTSGSRSERVPLILDDTTLNHPDFSVRRWNLLLSHFIEWVYPDKGIVIPASC